jgi:phosphoserine phosphatase
VHAVPWGDGPGRLPLLRVVDGPTLLRLVVQTRVHEITAADETGESDVREAWHDFADLMRDLSDSAADLAEADRVPLAAQLDLLIAELRRHGFRVVAGASGAIFYVAVLPRGYRQDVRRLFAAS